MNIVNRGYEEVAPNSIAEHPDNARVGSESLIRESIEVNGFYGACIVDVRTRQILAGNHRYRVMRKAGAERVPVIWVEVDDETAKQILAVDNRSNDIATYDRDKLRAFLASFARPAFGTGYSEAAVKALLAETAGRGSLLRVADVSIAEPVHTVTPGDVWQIERHTLICADVMSEWALWGPYLDDAEALFVPYPGPYAALSEKAERRRLVLVQPDPYIAGHVLDKYCAMRGESALRQLIPAQL